jgi:hypothetical protein
VTRRSDVMMSVEGEASPERRKGGDNDSWIDANFIRPKNKENSRDRFSWYKIDGEHLK